MLIVLCANFSLACMQLDLLNVYNQGAVTDYLSNEDEIEIKIGVGTQFVYSLENDFYRH